MTITFLTFVAMEKKSRNFREYPVWQESVDFSTQIYKLTSDMPWFEKKGLCDQLQRAVVSIASNIAEGLSRSAIKEQAHFLDIAYGSLMEVDCQLDISLDLGYISNEMKQLLDIEINDIAKMIRSLKMHRISSPIANRQLPITK